MHKLHGCWKQKHSHKALVQVPDVSAIKKGLVIFAQVTQ